MKWKRKPGAAVILCSVLLLSACGGTEAPASTVPPTSGEAPAISQPAEPEPPASSAVPEPEPPEPASSSVESREEPQPEPGAGMKVPEGCRAEWKLSNGTLILMGYDPGGRTQVQLPTGGSYQIGGELLCGKRDPHRGGLPGGCDGDRAGSLPGLQCFENGGLLGLPDTGDREPCL